MEYYRYVVEFYRNNPQNLKYEVYLKWSKLKRCIVVSEELFYIIAENIKTFNQKFELIEQIETKN